MYVCMYVCQTAIQECLPNIHLVAPLKSYIYSNINLHILSVEWRVLEKKFNTFCNNLPHNHQLTVDKLTVIPEFLKDGGEQLSKLIASSLSIDVRKLNEKIIAYIIVKSCYNDSSTSLVRLCDELIDSTDSSTNVQQNSYGM